MKEGGKRQWKKKYRNVKLVIFKKKRGKIMETLKVKVVG